MTESSRIVELLSGPATYPDRPSAVQPIETHISWVFLTDCHAYKLKKPVRFEFVDFSHPALRRRACEEEVRLNRRLAPSVYLAVLPITRAPDGALALGGAGERIDSVVQMRRLPADKALDEVLRCGRLDPRQAQDVAEHLAGFYARLPAESLSPAAYRHAIRVHIEANRDALQSLLPAKQLLIRRVVGAQLQYLSLHRSRFDERVAAGRIVDGHGDLRPEHIYLETPPAVIDCIEFSAELRRIDIADELSFLTMECERIGHRATGEQVLAAYQGASGDRIAAALLAFYESYRACVRAKVCGLRASQQSDSPRTASAGAVDEYLALADRQAMQLGPAVLLVVGGLMGTGKSTLARRLADELGAELLSTDRVRRTALGDSEAPADYGQGRYRPEMRATIYEEVFSQAGRRLDEGRSVVLDGTFLTNALRRRAVELAHGRRAASLAVVCRCPRDVAVARIEKRHRAGGADSEARAELYDLQAREFEVPTAAEAVVSVNTALAADQHLELIFNELRRRISHCRSGYA